MSTLERNAYAELRGAGLFSGTEADDDHVIGLVCDFCELSDRLNVSVRARRIALALLEDLAFGMPIAPSRQLVLDTVCGPVKQS